MTYLRLKLTSEYVADVALSTQPQTYSVCVFETFLQYGVSFSTIGRSGQKKRKMPMCLCIVVVFCKILFSIIFQFNFIATNKTSFLVLLVFFLLDPFFDIFSFSHFGFPLVNTREGTWLHRRMTAQASEEEGVDKRILNGRGKTTMFSLAQSQILRDIFTCLSYFQYIFWRNEPLRPNNHFKHKHNQ